MHSQICASCMKKENMNNNMNDMNNNNNMEKWAVSAMCQNHVSYSYAFNITWLNVIIVKEYLSGFISL